MKRLNACGCWITLLLIAPLVAQGQELIHLSADVSITPADNLSVLKDHSTIREESGFLSFTTFTDIPLSADLIGYGEALGGDRFIVLDTTSVLSGGVVARAGDVVRKIGAVSSIEFDASANGIPPGTRVDAVALSPNGLLLSFDTTVNLPGGITAADEDLVEWDGSGYAMLLDLSATGINVALDVDAAAIGPGRYYVSLSSGGQVGSVVFADEDILEWDGTAWSLYLATTSLDPDWAAADVDALMVPEPGFGLMLFVGMSPFILARRTFCRSLR